jgi:hypothetical protein
MKPINKWISTAMLVIAGLLALYYTGVLNSKITVGVALTAMSVVLFLTVLLRPHEHEDE